ncbi:MAG: ParA family protein [Pseudomonadota bacterium]
MATTLTFAQQKGGAGKTTALVQLAVALSGRGHSVALLDLDPQGSLARWAGLRGDAALPCTASSDWKAAGDLRKLKREHDLVLVDCPGNADILLRATIRDSDLVISPCQPSAMDIWALAPVIEMAAKEKTPLHVLMNRVPPRGGAVEEMVAMIEAPVLGPRLGNRIAFATAFLAGKSAAEAQPRSKAAEDVAAFADAVEALL